MHTVEDEHVLQPVIAEGHDWHSLEEFTKVVLVEHLVQAVEFVHYKQFVNGMLHWAQLGPVEYFWGVHAKHTVCVSQSTHPGMASEHGLHCAIEVLKKLAPEHKVQKVLVLQLEHPGITVHGEHFWVELT